MERTSTKIIHARELIWNDKIVKFTTIFQEHIYIFYMIVIKAINSIELNSRVYFDFVVPYFRHD